MRDWEKMCLKGLCLPPPPIPPSMELEKGDQDTI